MQMAQIIEQLEGMMQQLQQELESKQGDQIVKLETTKMKEHGQDRRKAADIAAGMKMKAMDLKNPVVGETRQ